MKKRQQKTPIGRNYAQISAMALAGIGFFILAGLAMFYLAKPEQAGGAGEEQAYTSAIPIRVDFPAPALELADLEGKPASLSDYAGQVVLVNNWAFWCPPCRAELPILQDYYQDHRQQGFTLIGIEAGGEQEDVDYHVQLYQLTYPIWLDPQERSLRAFQNNGLPNSAVIDRSGKMALTWNGPISREMLEEYVTPLLSK